jgi:hypothetical protein
VVNRGVRVGDSKNIIRNALIDLTCASMSGA